MQPQAPRPLRPSDDTAGFLCGEESLDRYLRDRALANHVRDLARCYVTTDADTDAILGYYTLSAISVTRQQLARSLRHGTPDAIPAVLLGRLAVDERAQGCGLGRFLVRDAVLSTLAAADRIGVRILLVHALNERVAGFYDGLGFATSPTDPLHRYLLLADARKSLLP